MIETIILKVTHKGEQEARKLIPYIESCDIFGVEDAGCTETGATQREMDWQSIIAAEVSRTMLQKLFPCTDPNEGMKKYVAQVQHYLHRNKKLIWHLERFSKEDAEKVHLLHSKSNACGYRAETALQQGDGETFFSQYWLCLDFIVKEISLRDREMAKNLAVAEERIRERYAALRQKEPIKFTALVGGLHEPEKHYGSVTVQPLDNRSFESKVVEQVRDGRSHLHLKKELLAFALERKYKISFEKVMGMPEEQAIAFALQKYMALTT